MDARLRAVRMQPPPRERSATAAPAKDLGAAIPQATGPAARRRAGCVGELQRLYRSLRQRGTAAGPTTASWPPRLLPPRRTWKPMHVRTDVLDLDISPVGGTIIRADSARLRQEERRSRARAV